MKKMPLLPSIVILIFSILSFGCVRTQENGSFKKVKSSGRGLFLDAIYKSSELDTLKYHIYLDTIFAVDSSEFVGLLNFIEREKEPCSHADCSELRFAYFKNTSDGIVCTRYTTSLNSLPFCDMPQSKLLNVGNFPLIATWHEDGNQGNFDCYIDIHDSRENSLGNLMLDKVVNIKRDSIVSIYNGTDNNEDLFEYNGNVSFDVLNDSTLKIVNRYSTVFNRSDTSRTKQVPVTGFEFWKYLLKEDKLILLEEIKKGTN